MGQSIDVSVVARNEIAREGLSRILVSEGFTLLGTATDTQTLTPVARTDAKGRSHIIIVDDGDDGTRISQIHDRFPGARIVVLADEFNVEAVTAAFGCGIDGYFIKEISCGPLIESLKLVALGEKVLPSQLACSLGGMWSSLSSKTCQDNVPAANLSEREVEILQCLALGLPNKVVCRRLSITEATVKVHVKAILRKLRVTNRTQAAIWAVKHGLEQSFEDTPGRTPPAEEAPGLEHTLECAE